MSIRDADDEMVVREIVLDGELDAARVPDVALQFTMLRAAGAPPSSVVTDLSGVTFIDSSGLRLLLDQRARLTEAGIDLRLRNPSATVLRLLELAQLTDHFCIELGD